jgi:4-hydroxybenzoate polyprenyltransferase
MFLCALAFFILIQFNTLTIILGIASMILAFSYPFMKRITYWPQLFLGLTFNWGIVMAWTAVTGNISIEILVLYSAAIFWTLGYDTIYGIQDIKDDEIIGIKSTSIKFKKNIKLFVSLCYFFSSTLLICLFHDKLGLNSFTILVIVFILSLMYQIKKFKKDNSEECLKAFKLNNFSGFVLFFGIFLIN